APPPRAVHRPGAGRALHPPDGLRRGAAAAPRRPASLRHQQRRGRGGDDRRSHPLCAGGGRADRQQLPGRRLQGHLGSGESSGMKRGAEHGRPLIGVTTSEVREPKRIQQTPESEPKVREMVLGLTYLRAIEAAGALPMVVPPLPEEAIGSLLDRLDGICLSGGPDLDPDTYGASPHPDLGPTEPDLDRFELSVARCAGAREIPILAICRGTQALNVARG